MKGIGIKIRPIACMSCVSEIKSALTCGGIKEAEAYPKKKM